MIISQISSLKNSLELIGLTNKPMWGVTRGSIIDRLRRPWKTLNTITRPFYPIIHPDTKQCMLILEASVILTKIDRINTLKVIMVDVDWTKPKSNNNHIERPIMVIVLNKSKREWLHRSEKQRPQCHALKGWKKSKSPRRRSSRKRNYLYKGIMF